MSATRNHARVRLVFEPERPIERRAATFAESKTGKMNGLRVYINLMNREAPDDDPVFYSRREDGPYYRWSYERRLGQWRSSRVRLPDLMLRALSNASWESVPTALQARLSQHYLE